MNKPLTIICCLTIACATSAAVAAPSYRFAFDQSNYLVVPGGTVDVTIYLQETPGSDTSVLDANGVGIYGAGVTITDVGLLPTHPAKVVSTANIAGVALFNDPGARQTAVADSPVITASLSEATDFLSFVHADDPTPGLTDYFVTIGTFTFTAGSMPGVTHIQTGPTYNSDGHQVDVNATADLLPLDALIADGMATITTVPEPPAFVLAMLGLAGLLAHNGWRRR